MALTFIDSTKLSGRDYFSDSGRDYEDLSSLSILSSRMVILRSIFFISVHDISLFLSVVKPSM